MAGWIPLNQIAGVVDAGSPVPPAFNPNAAANSGPSNYAGFFLRFVAALIDGFIIFGVNIILGFALGPIGAVLLVQPLSVLIGWLYFGLMESSKLQGTIGKRALGIKVTDLHGQPIGFGRATGRHFAKFISAFICLIGYIMAAFTQRKQALHDQIAGCLVVRK